MIGLALVVAINSLGSSFLSSISEEFDESFARDLTVQPRGFAPGQGPQQTIAPDLQARLEQIPEAKIVTPRAPRLRRPTCPVEEGQLDPLGLAVRLRPRESTTTSMRPSWTGRGLARGDLPHAGQRPGEIGKGYADEAGIEVGDTMVLAGPSGTRDAKVAAIVETVFAGGQSVGMSLETIEADLRHQRRLPARPEGDLR